MAKFRADVDEPRYYPGLGVAVNPADEVELPDGTVAAGLTLLDAVKKSVNPKSADSADSAQGA